MPFPSHVTTHAAEALARLTDMFRRPPLPVAATPFLVDRLRFPVAGSQYKTSGTPFSSFTPGTVRFRFRFDTLPSTSFNWLAGFSAGGSGFLFCTDDLLGASLHGQFVCYLGHDSTLEVVGKRFLLPEQIGNLITVHLSLPGGRARMYLDGWDCGHGYETAGFGIPYTNYDRPFVDLGIGARSDGAFGPSAQSVVEMSMTPTVLTPAQILDDAAKPVGSPMLGEAYRWTASEAGVSAWAGSAGAVGLTSSGGAEKSKVKALPNRIKRAWSIWGDSIAAGTLPSNLTGNGWRRTLQKTLSAQGHAISFVGYVTPSGVFNKDFDFWHNATPGEALFGRLTHATAPLSGELPKVLGPTSGIIFAYGSNDIAALGRSTSQLSADLTTACSLANSVVPGLPIVIQDVLPIGVGASGYTPTKAAEILTFNAQFASMISTLQASYNVRGVVCSTLITDPNDPSQLFDKTHPTDIVLDRMAAAYAPVIQASG